MRWGWAHHSRPTDESHRNVTKIKRRIWYRGFFSGKFEYASVVNVQKRQIHKCTKNTNTKFVGGLILFYSAHCSSDIAPLLLLLLPSPLSFIQTLQNGLIGVPRTPCVFLWTEVGKKYKANTIQNNTPPYPLGEYESILVPSVSIARLQNNKHFVAQKKSNHHHRRQVPLFVTFLVRFQIKLNYKIHSIERNA